MLSSLIRSNKTRAAAAGSSKGSDHNDEKGLSCYLKSCHLCQKLLSPDKEIYMYRGDLGFCSVDCRERQIYMEEMKEIEAFKQCRLQRCRWRR